ncbi:hypothetical protein K469DRAFT_684828 [Zopfia rhizophila CBS 207.26]|uniref:G domain-containing protein n=1 Tax=Zopfia rhizophila CBS 207.26 TaxID=1314779 RepID=A0A6A6D674_9PEZI|nr:hypothetical protein K469DRAFT_684828 [Zopfia rhizophila CBS 207.26]
MSEEKVSSSLGSSWLSNFEEDMEEALPAQEGEIFRHPNFQQSSSTSDLAILIMGVTGSGKSTFISRLTEQSVEIGHSLESCTTKVKGYMIRSTSGQNIYLIDTPGFDDTQISNVDLLQKIASALITMYADNDIRFGGLIYMHRITDQRVAGSSLKSLRIFENICGEENFPNIVLVTTMWNLLGPRNGYKMGEDRETTLKMKDEFFGKMVAGGAKMMRDDGDQASADDIIKYISRQKSRVVTAIQREIVDGKRHLGETAVGQLLHGDLTQARRRYEMEREELEEALEEAIRDQDDNLKLAISDQKRETEERIRQMDIDEEALSVVDFDKLAQGGSAWCMEMLREAERAKEENEILSRQIIDLEEQLHRTEIENLRAVNKMRQEQKGKSREYEHALKDALEEQNRRFENEKKRLVTHLNQRKAASKAKEGEIQKHKSTEGFLLMISKALVPPDRGASLNPRRTQSFPIGPLPLFTPRRDSKPSANRSRRSRFEKERPRSHYDIVRSADPDYSIGGSEDPVDYSQDIRVVTSHPPSIPAVHNAQDVQTYGGHPVTLAFPSLGYPRRVPETSNPPLRRSYSSFEEK